MRRFRQTRLASYIALLLIVAMYVAPVANAAKAKNAVVVPAKTVVVFPFDDAAQIAVETLSQDLASKIQSNLSATGVYRAIAFSEQLPPIKRAVKELVLRPNDLKGPFGTEEEQIASAIKVAREMAADYVLVGSIDDVTVDTENNKAEVTLTAVLANGSTGEAAQSVAVTGAASANTDQTTEDELITLAAQDAVAKMIKQISPDTEQQVTTTTKPVVTEKRKKSSTLRKLLIPILLGVAVGLLATSNDDNNNSGGTIEDPDNPPDSPF
ncbi:MAG TPA: hypothetical protein PLU88_09805 [Armatimonadota bacterium]|jgi:hypothetical protein|nr:hypothetical protein [Armatimonadota bacterium]HPP75403.1 hypothetical protein [Armatimonadota bacterium]